MMKKKTMWISAAIAIVVAIPGVSAFAETVSTTTPAATSTVTATTAPTASPDANAPDFNGRDGHGQGGGHGKGSMRDGFQGGFGGGGAKGSAHSEEYLTLLAEKYAPDQTASIKAAYDERATIDKQIKELRDANKTTLEANKTANDQKRADEKVQIDAIKAKVTSGELTQAQADEQIKALRDANRPAKQELTAEEQAQREADKALHDSFDAAIQTVVDGGSTDQLTTILPKLVENLKAQNQKASDRLAKLKTEVSAG